MSSPYLETTDRNHLRTLTKAILGMFLLVAVALFYWSMPRAETILGRNDNPRLLEQELRIRRGVILDKNNTVLAVSEGEDERLQRIYPLADIGPTVGFYSVIHGTAGIEDSFDALLRNDPTNWWTSLSQSTLHAAQEGKAVKLALDANLQLKARAALGQHRGAVLLLEINEDDPHRAWIRALVSQPGYDPNLLDEQFEALGADEDAPLLNRVTQGQYQPGLLLQPIVLAAALDQGLIGMNDQVQNPNQIVEINGVQLQCKSPAPDPASWSDVLRLQCPGPTQKLAEQLHISGLDAAFSSFGLYRDPSLEINTVTTPDEPLNDPLLAGIGQDNLSITPLQIGLAISALTNGGTLPQPQVGLAVQNSEGSWQPWIMESAESQPTTSETASLVLQALPQEDAFWEYSSLVLSGPDDTTNAWYLGILELDAQDYVAVVVLEHNKLEEQVLEVGRSILSAVSGS